MLISGADMVMAGLAVLAAALVMGFTGFAFNLLSVPLLALLMPVRQAVVVALVVGTVISGVMAVRGRIDVQPAAIMPLLKGGLPGLLLGALLFTTLSDTLLRICVGVLTVAFAVHLFARRRPRLIAIRSSAAIGVGALSGALTSMTGMGGPPVVAYLTHTIEDPAGIRITMAAHAATLGLIGLVVLGMSGAVSTAPFFRGVVLAPVGVMGMLLGAASFRRMPGLYTKAVAATLLVVGVIGASLPLVGDRL